MVAGTLAYRRPAALALLLALAVAACSSSHPVGNGPDTGTDVSPTTGSVVWLCQPGQADDPCTVSLASTVVPTSGVRTAKTPESDPSSAFDCFYIYPTVSTESTNNADLVIQPAERDAAELQAANFSPLCRVWAPMYHQVTDAGLLDGAAFKPANIAIAYNSLLTAWDQYLTHDNDGRPVILIGHSQGAAMLIRLLAARIDPVPSVRERLVMAIIAGGNVAVPTGATVGASFQHIPLCTANGQTGCVIAYSTFPSEPPTGAFFGRPDQGVSLQSGQTQKTGVQIACTNPADLAGGTADLDSIFPTLEFPPKPTVRTPWVVYPDLYSASCESAGGATWLQVNTLTAAGRPTVTESLGPAWGYHLDDVNLPLGNLVSDVAAAEVSYSAAHG